MRYTGPVRFSHHGDKEVARQHNVIARNLLGMMAAASQQPFSTRSVLLSNGVRITVEIIAQPVGLDRNWAEDAVSMMWSGQYQVSAHIYAPPGAVKDLGEIQKVYQYQFVYTGGAGKYWDVYEVEYDSLQAGGSAVAAIFVIRENGVDHASFPLVSTLKEPPAEDQWIFLEELTFNVQPWLNALPIPRYEVAHATAEHLFNPDEENLIHSAWMPKGGRHYMAQAYQVGTMRQSGTLNMRVADGDKVLVEDFLLLATSPTDVTYETDLQPYEPPQATAPYTQQSRKGEVINSAPDTDWFMSYGVQEAELPDGTTRQFGVMVDSAQKVYVWPLDATGTDVPNPDYADQRIKGNVAPAYVKTYQLNFPPDVYVNTFSYRDAFTGGYADPPNVFGEEPYRNSSRYGWMPSPDGRKYVCVVERHHDPLTPEDRFTGPTADPPVYFDDEFDYRIADPAVATFEISINAFGIFLGDFSISVSAVDIEEPGESFFPVQAEFAQEGAFEGVEAGDLLVAGFEARRLDDAVDNWSFTQQMATQGDAFPDWTNIPPYVAAFLVCNAAEPTLLPAPVTSVTRHNMEFGPGFLGSYQHVMPPYMRQDECFTVQDVFASTDEIEPSFVMPNQKSFVMEGRFIVKKGEEEIFSRCCRKYRKNEFSFGNFFTAKVCSLRLATGSIVFGLCESETYLTSVDQRVGQFDVPNPLYGDWSDQEGRNTTTKGYAIFHQGEQVETSSQPLAQSLNEELDSIVLSKGLSFWGTLLDPTISVTPPVTANTFAFSAEAFNRQYAASIGAFFDGHTGVRNFPWGLEMYGWFAKNHYSSDSTQEIVSGEDFLAYSNVYFDVRGEVVVAPMSNQVTSNPTVDLQTVDTIRVGGRKFTHAALYEEAFGEAPELDFDVRLEQVNRAPQLEGGGSLGYPYQVATPSSDEDSWRYGPVYAPFIGVFDGAGEMIKAAHLLTPNVRVYCDIGGSPAPIHYDIPTFEDELARRKQEGLQNAPFVAKAYGLVEIADGD